MKSPEKTYVSVYVISWLIVLLILCAEIFRLPKALLIALYPLTWILFSIQFWKHERMKNSTKALWVTGFILNFPIIALIFVLWKRKREI